MGTWIFNEDLPIWKKVRERMKAREAEELKEKEFQKAVAKSQARAHIETWCRCYSLPIEAIEETENSYVFKVEFKF